MRRWCVIAAVAALALWGGGPARAQGGRLREIRITDVDLQDADLAGFLRLLAEQNGLNIIAGPEVQGTVTVHLRDVSLEEALATVLRSNGYGYTEQEGVIVVEPRGEGQAEGAETRVFPLKYLNAKDVKAALEGIVGGKVQTFTRTLQGVAEEEGPQSTILLVTDTPSALARVEAIIRALDVPVRQVSIEVKMIETILARDEVHGIGWPKSLDLLYSSLSFEEKSRFNAIGGASSSAFQVVGDAFRVGKLSGKELQAVLDFLTRDENSKLLSSPSITTLDNQEAEIAVTTSVPIQTISSLGVSVPFQNVVSFHYVDIGIRLTVTPRVNEDNSITLVAAPTVEEITGFTGPVDLQIPITSKRSARTQVMVHDGETVAIGGLIQDNARETVEKVWLLGDIPLLGHLFRHRTATSDKSDLLIFITPRIVTE